MAKKLIFKPSCKKKLAERDVWPVIFNRNKINMEISDARAHPIYPIYQYTLGHTEKRSYLMKGSKFPKDSFIVCLMPIVLI